MAKKRSGRRAGKEPMIKLPMGIKTDIVGIALIVLAVLTLLSLVSLSRGSLTESWIHILRLGFGIGVYLIPLGLGALGLWLVLVDIQEERKFDWEKPAGCLLLFLLLLTGAHLIASIGNESRTVAELGNGGGYLGWALSSTLVSLLGIVGTWIVLIALLFVSLILLLDVTLVEFGRLVALRWRMLFPPKEREGIEEPEIWVPPASVQTPSQAQPTYPTVQAGAQPPSASAGTSPQKAPEYAGPAQPSTSSGTVSPVPERFSVAPSAPSAGISVPRPVESQRGWQLPDIREILEEAGEVELSEAEVRERVRIIEETLASFGLPARVVEVNQGPAVTQFGVAPGFIEKRDASGRVKRSKVKVSRISALAKDLSLALAASPIRIEAPVPGRPIVGIEVPNSRTALVSLRSVMESEAFQSMKSPLKIALGQDVSGQPVCADLASMPHLLIAGATGSGKSVCINSIVACLLCGNTPETLRLLMIDPKRVELIAYNGVPHLLSPVVVDLKRVVDALQWATREMDRRYQLFAKAGVRNLEGYNERQMQLGEPILPLIVIVIDELADLMMIAPDEVERAVCRIAQMARATGIHLIIATQRPSVDVVTGLIKANFPARIAFAVSSQVDSRVILDVAGAEQLLGRGDMLYMAPDSAKLRRLQGCFVSDRELYRLVRYWKGIRDLQEEHVRETYQPALWPEILVEPEPVRRDDLFDEAVRVIQAYDRASISLLQRRLRIGYARAARLIEMLEEEGYVGPEEGASRSRRVLIKKDGAAGEFNKSDI